MGRAFTDERVRAGITSVDPRTFAGGRIGGPGRRVSLQEFRQARTISGRLPIEPTRANMSASHMAARANAIPSRSFSQTRFFSPGASAQRGFAGAGAGSRDSFGRASQAPMSRASGSLARPAPPAGSMATGPRGAAPGGWQRFSQAAPGAAGSRGGFPAQPRFGTPRPAGPQSGQTGGWQRFSETGRRPLNLNKPFMNQRSPQPSGGAPNSGRSYSAPRSFGGSPYDGANGPRGGNAAPRTYTYSTPRGYGGFSAPRGYNVPRPNSSAPRSYSAPRGHPSAPRGGGGSHGGGFHAGGGHHGGGGGGHHGGGHGRH